MTELEIIGSLYIQWLQSHRNAYTYHKSAIDMMTTEIKDDYGNYQQELDQKPPDYDFKQWQEVNQLYKNESANAEKLYQSLLEKADLYIAKLVLEQIE